MLWKLWNWAEDTTHVVPAVQAFLWWGIALRAVLLFALATLLAVEGNFLAEWLLSWEVAPASAAEIEDYTTVSYAALLVFLSMGVTARLLTLHRLRERETDAHGRVPEAEAETPTPEE